MRSGFFVKRSSAADHILLFLVTAAASVLLTRLFLYVFDYPQIGNDTFHIAHAVQGGFFLTASVLLLLAFHGRRVRQLAAILAGWGFGQFIDEIGKFITRDNDYFYRPVPVIIYLTFITVFFLYRHFERYTPKHPKELSFDLIENLEELLESPFVKSQRQLIETTIVKILNAPDTTYRYFARGIHNLLEAVPVRSAPPRRVTVWGQLRRSWQWLDDFTAERRPVFYSLVAIFIIYVFTTFWTMSVFFFRLNQSSFNVMALGFDSRSEWFIYLAELVSQAVSALWMCQGLWWLFRRQRRRALVLFKNGLAINILITHVFAFYIEQFSASISLLIMLGLFLVVENILDEHQEE